MDRALGGEANVTGEPLDQELADLAGSPMGALTLGADDQALDLDRQLVGIAPRPSGSIAEGFQPVLLAAIEALVACLARDAELVGIAQVKG